MELQQYISDAFPDGLRYNEAAQLCLRLFCSLDGVPEQLHPQCNKDNLAEVFARLSGSGFITDDAKLFASKYGANFHAVNEKGHWVEVISSIFKMGGTVDASVANALAQTLGNSFESDSLKTTRASS
jgi:hypothetical protein